MYTPLVSILIPFKNTEAYLGDCLNSILAQNYAHWEVLAVNDRSDDASLAVFGKFMQADSRFRVFENNGSGIIDALRLAYSKSSGTMITRMDSDDLMAPHKIETMVQALHRYGMGHLAIGQVQYFAEEGISAGYARYEAWLNHLTLTGANFNEIYKECVIPSPCWMVFKTDLERSGAFLPDRYPEDYDLAFRFRGAGLKCIPCDTVLHNWRDYAKRTSRTSHHYAQNYFIGIKLHYFLQQDYDPSRTLVVWGAGFKGKCVVKWLLENEISFEWICDNPKKMNKNIYGVTLKPFSDLAQMVQSQSIITVANEIEQTAIRNYFNQLKQVEMKDYFFFC